MMHENQRITSRIGAPQSAGGAACAGWLLASTGCQIPRRDAIYRPAMDAPVPPRWVAATTATVCIGTPTRASGTRAPDRPVLARSLGHRLWLRHRSLDRAASDPADHR